MKVIGVPPFVSRLHMNDVVGVEVSFPDWYITDEDSDVACHSWVDYYPLRTWHRRVPEFHEIHQAPSGARVVVNAWIEGPSRPGGVQPIYCVSGVVPPRQS